MTRSHVRWFPILALVTAGTAINFLDRTVLGVAAPFLTRELGLDAALMGIVFSAFSWSYASFQIPGGVFLDRFGVRLTYALAASLWSACLMLMGLAQSVVHLILARIGLGVFEAPHAPAASRILSTWFPQHERARAAGVYHVGMYVGLGFLSAPLFWLCQAVGWRVLFVLLGGLGVAFGLVWWRVFHEPTDSRLTNAAEIDYIKAGGGLGHPGARTPFAWRHIGALLRHRQIVGASIGQFGGNSTLVFFLTWFPSYLVRERHMEFLTAGYMAALPYIGASVGVLSGGVLSDWLLKRTGSANLARKLPMVTGLLLASTIIVANYVDATNDALVIAVMSIAFFGQGMTNLGWTVIADIAPKNLFGLTGGIFNFSANLAGIMTPLVVGFAYQATGSFAGPLAYIAVAALVGACSYLFVMGDVRRLEVAAD